MNCNCASFISVPVIELCPNTETIYFRAANLAGKLGETCFFHFSFSSYENVKHILSAGCVWLMNIFTLMRWVWPNVIISVALSGTCGRKVPEGRVAVVRVLWWVGLVGYDVSSNGDREVDWR